ncbi:coiled-coil domain-containing protein 97 isoform X1 [Hylaeus anthracinus]|uniref:coiled-coil domain-containing protein 97 isoform X1 n=1 Tax=Hylaeus anthracinus TaxID=313031 RepID=UPI0023B938A3|nr:coiled-coil domain-containing protein 97 isoform X1 [Hylaeus anthracinus]
MSEKEHSQDYASEMTLNEKDNNNSEESILNKEKDTNLEEEILNHVGRSKAIFKSQQKEDPDLTFEEKLTIARNILKKSYCLFLSKFGRYMKEEHLKYFEKSKDKDYEVAYHINRLRRYFNNSTRVTDVKNRRYQALKTLVKQGEYFSETEMMKRNPLLYEHLIGQYMTEKQKKIRDNIDTTNITFVNLLMESIDRDSLKQKRKLQEEEEQDVLEETESDEEQDEIYISRDLNCSKESNFQWGRLPTLQNETHHQNIHRQINKTACNISKTEKQILKQEFVSNMYQNFLDGRDDFDYSTVDDNEAYDNIDLRSQDEEDKYFDSESPENVCPSEDRSEVETEDELDIYMKSLKEQVTTSTLSLDNLVCDNSCKT